MNCQRPKITQCFKDLSYVKHLFIIEPLVNLNPKHFLIGERPAEIKHPLTDKYVLRIV